MKHYDFRRGCIIPLIRFSVWIMQNSTDDDEEHFATFYITDDFGNAVNVKASQLWNWNRELHPTGQYLWH